MRHKNIEVAVDRDQGTNRWTNTFWRNICISFVNPGWPNAVWWGLVIVQGICGNVFSHKFWKKKRPTFLFVLHKGAMKWGPCTCITFQSFQLTYHARNGPNTGSLAPRERKRVNKKKKKNLKFKSCKYLWHSFFKVWKIKWICAL